MSTRRATSGSHGAGLEQMVLSDAHEYGDRRNRANRFTPTNLSQAVAFRRISSQAASQSLAIGCAL